MRISSVQWENFRNLRSGSLVLGSRLNWFCGPNGQGKTNFLEMVYFALTGKSFRTGRLLDMVLGNGRDARVSAKMSKGEAATLFTVAVEDGKSRRLIGEKACTAMDFFKNTAVISFTDRAKNLVVGSPDDRRRFMDRMVATLDPDYIASLGQYRKIRNQLKKVLLENRDLRVYQSFKGTLLPVAVRIVERRMALLTSIRERAIEIFNDVFLGEGRLHFEYKLRSAKGLEEYEKKFTHISAQEMLQRKSLMGPHLDDMQILVEKNNARHYASSGQVRAIVLSIKLAVRESYKNRRGHLPILLLDDIDAELDGQRLESFMNYLKTEGQTLITTSKYGIIGDDEQGDIFLVSAGCINPKE